jgi:hypothetical protein
MSLAQIGENSVFMNIAGEKYSIQELKKTSIQ